MVRISAAEVRVNRSVNTDAEGRYEVAELPAGRYNIFVMRNGYVSLQFGQRRPFESGRPLEVGEGQTAEKIDFALPRGGVIAGRIVDELGEPLAGVRMQAMRHQYSPNGQKQLSPAGGMGGPFAITTNDLGEFRLFGLMPGAYVVSATPAEAGGMMVTPGGPPTPADNEGHGITYYPGTINADEAQAVTVGLSEEASASFSLVPSRMTRVSGIIRNSQGQPVTNVMVTVRPRATGMFMGMRSFAGPGPDGRFNITNVPPGEHWLEVSSRSPDGESASVPITTADRDITDLMVTTSPGAVISGTVIFEGASASTKPGRIMIYSPDMGAPSPMRFFDDTQGTIDQAGQFQIKNVFGRVLFQIGPVNFGPPPTGWSLKSVTLNGADVTDTPLDLAATGSVSGLQIVVTDKQTTLSGTVRNASGSAVNDYTVAIFPDKVREGAVSGRYTRIVRPDQDGRFQSRGLPPGDYVAAAVESLEQGGQWDPAFRKQVEPTSKRFRLIEGQTTTIELQLTQ
jgi:hypothetical protein